MAASKLKNRRRFITRDMRMDIPEDEEFIMSPEDGDTSLHPGLFLSEETEPIDRTWPRRTVGTPSGLYSALPTLPRFRAGFYSPQSVLARMGASTNFRLQPPAKCRLPWEGNNSNSCTTPQSSSSSSDNRWRFRSVQDMMSPNCLSSVSSPSETASEPCYTSKHPVETEVPSSTNIYSESRRNNTLSVVRSVPELNDISGEQSTSGSDSIRRAYSLNENSVPRPFVNRFPTVQPGSVLHRAMNWEVGGGKPKPFRAVVSPLRDKPITEVPIPPFGKNQTVISRGSCAVDRPNTSNSIWMESVTSDTRPWTQKESGLPVESNRNVLLFPENRNTVDSYSELMNKRSQRTASCSPRLNRKTQYTISNTIRDDGMTQLHQLSDNDVFREREYNDFYKGRSEDPRQESSMQYDDPYQHGNTFPESQSEEFERTESFLVVPNSNKTFPQQRQDYDPFRSSETRNNLFVPGRKPFRSKSLRLLNSGSAFVPLDGDSAIQNAPLEWKSSALCLSTPTSPISPPIEVGRPADQKQPTKHILSKPFQSMVTLNSKVPEQTESLGYWNNFRNTSLARSTENFLGGGSSVNHGNFEVHSPFSVIQHKTVTEQPKITAEEPKLRVSNVKPLGSNFVVKKLTNLPKNPFMSTFEDGALKKIDSYQTGKKIAEFQTNISTFANRDLKKTDSKPAEYLPSAEIFRKLEKNLAELNDFQSGVEINSLRTFSTNGDLKNSCYAPVCEQPKTTFAPGRTGSSNQQKFTTYKDMDIEEPPMMEFAVKSENATTESKDLYDSFVKHDKESSDNEEAPPRLIRVFLKSPSRPNDDVRPIVSATCDTPEQNVTVCQVLDTNQSRANEKKEVWRSEWKSGFQNKIDDLAMFIESLEREDPFESLSQKGNIGERKASDPCVESRFGKQGGGGEMNSENKGVVETKPANIVNKCFLEIKNNDSTATKKPFEIVKKKLIIPEPMSLFTSRNKNHNSTAKQNFGKQEEKTTNKLQISNGLGTSGIQASESKTISSDAGYTGKPDSIQFMPTGDSKLKTNIQSDEKPYQSTCVTSVAAPDVLRKAPVKYTSSSIENMLSMTACSRPNAVCTGIQQRENSTDTSKATKYNGGLKKDEETVGNGKKFVSEPQAGYNISTLDCWIDNTKGCEQQVVESKPRHEQVSDTKTYLEYLEAAIESLPFEEIPPELPTSIQCSIVSELDRAIEMLTSNRPLRKEPLRSNEKEVLPVGAGELKELGSKAAMGSTQVVSGNRSVINKFLTSSVPDETRVVRTVSSKAFILPERQSIPVCPVPGPSVQSIRVSSQLVDLSASKPGGAERFNQLLQMARQDSFNRPDSPMFHHTLALPKDSVILRHRMHQKESRCNGRSRSKSRSSSSESSENGSPVHRVAPRRTKKSKNACVKEPEVISDDDEKNEEQDSIISSTASIRPLSIDSSFLSDENL